MSDQVTKQDAGKPDWTLVVGPLRRALEAMVRVRMYGNHKYRHIAEAAGVPFDPESWRKNDARRYLASAQRHLAAAIDGERVNHEDGGCNHLAQAAIDLCFAFEVEAQQEAPANQNAPAGQPEALLERQELDARVQKASSMPGEAFAVGPPPSQGKWFLWTDDGGHVCLDPMNTDELPTLQLIANVLARKRRWADHFAGAITVARHCILVAAMVPEHLKRAALLHDASEALYGDRPTPLKHLERTMMAGEHPNDVLCHRFDRLLEQRYHLPARSLDDPAIKAADRLCNCWEALQRGVPDNELRGYYGAALTDKAKGLTLFLPTPDFDLADWMTEWENACQRS